MAFCCEGCCCPVLSLSITRMFVMDAKQLRPDPMDYQIIQCSNCLQILSCICWLGAMIIPVLDDAAQIIDCIADAFTATVAGCMGAQISAELSMPEGGSSATHIGSAGGPPQRVMVSTPNYGQAPVATTMYRGPESDAQMAARLQQEELNRGGGGGGQGHYAQPSYAQPTAQVMAAPIQQTMQVAVPDGVGPGSVLMVMTPVKNVFPRAFPGHSIHSLACSEQNGQQMQITVPPGIGPGGVLNVNY